MRHSHKNFGARGRRALRAEWAQADMDGRAAFGRFGPPGGFGPGGHFGPPGGFGPPGRRGAGGRRGGRPRGDVRTAILVLLGEQPRHGYELIRAIEERSGGMWSPSPGSVYPTLQALEDEGLLTIESVEGRKTASLTAEGQAWVQDHSDESAAVFTMPDGAHKTQELMQELRAVAEAASHVARHHDSPELAARAAAILASARKDLYRLLAEDEH